MVYRFVIEGRLPGLNEYIAAERANRYKAAKLKRDAQELIGYAIRTQLRDVHIKHPVVMRYLWVEANRKRDKDNISFARKFIQDALVGLEVLQNDGWKGIEGFSDSFAADEKRPRIEVEIIEWEGRANNESKVTDPQERVGENTGILR